MEKTTQLFMARDFGMALDVLKGKIVLETFERDSWMESDWNTFAKMVDADGAYYLAEALAGNDSGNFPSGQTIRYTFGNNTVPCITGFQLQGGEKKSVISLAQELTFRISYEWIWMKDDKELASALWVYGEMTHIQ